MGLDFTNGEVHGFAGRAIRRTARRLVGHADFNQSDVEDIQQECWLDLVRRQAAYAAARSKPQAHISALLKKKAANLLAARFAQKRDVRREVEADSATSSGYDHSNGHSAFDRDVRRPTLNCGSREANQRDLCADLAEVIDSLPEDQRQICALLRHETVSEVARRLGIPRTTIYGKFADIRRRLASLRVYLESDADISCSAAVETEWKNDHSAGAEA